MGEFISFNDLEAILIKFNNGSNLEISLVVTLLSLWASVLHSFDVGTSPDSGVGGGAEVDLDGVVSAEEGDDEFSLVVFLIFGNETGLES